MGALCHRGVARAVDRVRFQPSMSFFNRVPWRPRVDEEVDEELAFHLEMRTREYIAGGMDPAAARHKAERRFGDIRRMRTTLRTIGKGRNLQMQRTQYLNELRQDAAFTWRQLVKNPGFTAVAVLTLALGIGGTTAIFSAVYAVVLQPLPLRDPARLMRHLRNVPGLAVGGLRRQLHRCRRRRVRVRGNVGEAVFELQPLRRHDARAHHRRARHGELLRRHGRPAAARAGLHGRGRPAGQRTRGRPEPSAVDAPVRRQPRRWSAARLA